MSSPSQGASTVREHGAVNLETPVLSVRGLTVVERRSSRPIVSGLDLDLHPGETVGIVGESGSGKTTATLGMLGLLNAAELEVTGTATYGGVDLVTAPDRARRRLWGREIGVLYQDALRALNPVMRVGDQIAEVFEAHGLPVGQAEVVELLTRVGIASPEERSRSYIHQLSGGMRQRVMAAIAVALGPKLLIADEPTTALDVTIQAQVLDLITELSGTSEMATVIVSHDLGVIAGTCDRVVVLYNGRVVETASTEMLFASPRHPYTRALMSTTALIANVGDHRFHSIPGQPPSVDEETMPCAFAPRCAHATTLCATQRPLLLPSAAGATAACHHPQSERVQVVERPALPEQVGAVAVRPVVLQATGIRRYYEASKRGGPPVRAVDGVDLELREGEILGLVGESGSGKSTLGRLLIGLEGATEGEITYQGRHLASLRGSDRREFRRSAQMIYQDPRSSLNRGYKVASILRTALRAGGVVKGEVRDESVTLLERVGLNSSYLERHPGRLSGGECQRVAIARALSVRPQVIVADEAVSSLDVSIRGQILNLLLDVNAELGVAIVFIGHDLGVVRDLCDRASVMYLGRITESGPADEVLSDPAHPYTVALHSAAPVPDPVVERTRERVMLIGDPPSPAAPPSGCSFHTRCPVGPQVRAGREICHEQMPVLAGEGRTVACHFAGEGVVPLALGGVSDDR